MHLIDTNVAGWAQIIYDGFHRLVIDARGPMWLAQAVCCAHPDDASFDSLSTLSANVLRS